MEQAVRVDEHSLRWRYVHDPRVILGSHTLHVSISTLLALRLYPSVPRNMKVCVEDDVLPSTYTHTQTHTLSLAHIAMYLVYRNITY